VIVSDGNLVPAAFGDLTPSLANQYYYSRTGIELSSAFASYAAVYRAQVWVATLVNKIAYGTARLPLKVYRRLADDSREQARDTPFAKLIRNPNPRQDPFFFWLWTVSTHEVYGEAIWIKVRPAPGRPPSQLWPLHPANVTTYRRQTDGVLMYRFTRGAANDALLEWPASEVVHFKTYNPEDQVRGLSRLEPLRQTILNEDATRRAAAAVWKNGGRPSMTVTHPKTLSDGAQRRLEAQLAGLHQGVDNWGKIAILEEGMNPTLLPLDAEAMQYIEARHVNREEACGMYDVPPPVVHILDRATFSNITEQMRSMYRDTMAPRLGLFESVIDTQLRPDFDPRGELYAEFLLDEVLRGAFEQRAVANQSAIFSGQRTPNEVRRQDNLPPLDGGDKLYINAGAIPLEESGTTTDSRAQVVKVQHEGMKAQCHACQSSPAVSANGLCRSCAGRAGRMLATQGVEDA
jgi:HK97 family phage portal protein